MQHTVLRLLAVSLNHLRPFLLLGRISSSSTFSWVSTFDSLKSRSVSELQSHESFIFSRSTISICRRSNIEAASYCLVPRFLPGAWCAPLCSLHDRLITCRTFPFPFLFLIPTFALR